MNFLAHAYLSFDQPKVLVGNFIGDFVRGNLNVQFERDIITGIMLHREIDSYTDKHPLVKEAQKLLKPKFARYSSVITDMYFDYFLAKNWEQYSPVKLEDYTKSVYKLLESERAILPSKFLLPFKYMKEENWLMAYGTMAGIQRSFTGMAYRTTFDSKMELAPKFLQENHAVIESYFERFFEDLIQFSKNKLKQLHKRNG
ncbi:acyl carrier protein phosphodiesterase [Cyclobacterium amurskyense]|uniref:Acyl carrier protein phosphodiesterase n=1 Tax=Cyclobacterium amurskyense TaxID=320787 RepID=A0A0H4PH41_9BACT|nr:ACP phosphodiesterase [Cyclobacterium amurskyense]AKP52173.1 Acyl carrier protein phosphodiesterase [Cyclobacterium amurskyense]|tara:strand:+ start:20421 stop:21020 length:600 start_codon:yes stop_codon:yes gene_type:complete